MNPNRAYTYDQKTVASFTIYFYGANDDSCLYIKINHYPDAWK